MSGSFCRALGSEELGFLGSEEPLVYLRCTGCILAVADFGTSYLNRQPEMRRVERPHSFDKICFKDWLFRVPDLAVSCLESGRTFFQKSKGLNMEVVPTKTELHAQQVKRQSCRPHSPTSVLRTIKQWMALGSFVLEARCSVPIQRRPYLRGFRV